MMQIEVDLYKITAPKQTELYYLKTPFGIWVSGDEGTWTRAYFTGGFDSMRLYAEQTLKGKINVSNRLQFLLDKGISFEESLKRRIG
jgi:hypothetical protein